MLADFGKLEKNLKQDNNAKHGARVIHDPSLAAGEFLLIAPDRDPGRADRYTFFKFGSGDEIVEHTLKLVQWVSHSTQALVSFARNLKTAGLLY